MSYISFSVNKLIASVESYQEQNAMMFTRIMDALKRKDSRDDTQLTDMGESDLKLLPYDDVQKLLTLNELYKTKQDVKELLVSTEKISLCYFVSNQNEFKFAHRKKQNSNYLHSAIKMTYISYFYSKKLPSNLVM